MERLAVPCAKNILGKDIYIHWTAMVAAKRVRNISIAIASIQNSWNRDFI